MTEPIRQFFDRLARGRDRTISGNPIIDYEQRVRSAAVMAMLEPRAGELILDVGCGNGRDLLPLAQLGCRCVGVDYSPAMIQEARRDLAAAGIAAMDLLVGDATRLSFADASFDKVFASEVIEHIPDWPAAIREMARVLRPGGTVAITTPNRRSWYAFDRYVLIQGLLRRQWNHPLDQWKTSGEVAGALRDAGLEVSGGLGICFIPGFILTYRLPRLMQRCIVRATAAVERPLARALPQRGYMLGLKGQKPA
jgi:ubiquinone/menaquinone biosynthesis C-methylase UbiE